MGDGNFALDTGSKNNRKPRKTSHFRTIFKNRSVTGILAVWLPHWLPGGWTDFDPAETTGFGYRFGSSTSAIAPLIFASEINPEQNFHVFGFVDLVILQLQRFCQGGAADIPVAR